MFATRLLGATAIAGLALLSGDARAQVAGAQKISTDPFTNSNGQHETAVEPDSLSFGRNVVGVFQLGRIVDGGASGIGWGASNDGGVTWRSGVLPQLTQHQQPPGPYSRVSDPVVAYDRAHGVWLASALALRDAAGDVLSSVIVNRSSDGISWSAPVVVAPEVGRFDHDKPWIACGNGQCYAVWTTRPGQNGVMTLSASTDGGATWTAPAVFESVSGSGWQPLVRPDAALVIVYEGANEIASVVSRDGGRTFTAPVTIGALRAAAVPGVRAPPLPSAEIDAAGRIFVAWQDCRFRAGCPARGVPNDLVLASSKDGRTWSRVRRVPTWPMLDGQPHFVPGLAVDASTRSAVALAFYVLSPRGVAPMFVSSSNGGRTWSPPQGLAAPMPVDAFPLSTSGRFLGDYISTSFVDAGAAVPVFAGAAAPFDGRFHQGVFATRIPPFVSRDPRVLLRLGAATIAPRRPRVGQRVTVTVPVAGPARAITVRCSAGGPGVRLGRVVARVARNRATCTWLVRAARPGARVRGAMVVLSPEEEATRRFAFGLGVRTLSAARAQAVGEQRVLVLLATWGPQPWTRPEVQQAFSEADRFLRKSSFGQLGLRGDVTDWLPGYPAFPACPPPEHERIPLPLTTGPDAAAAAAGYRVESYDRVVYIVPRLDCPWLGVGVGRQVMLNGAMNTWGIVHELGHTYGLAHARGKDCRACRTDEYGDPFSPMGRGLVDFSAYEKLALGWIPDISVATVPGRYAIGRPDVTGATPHALVVKSGAGEYWFEQRLDVDQPGLAVRRIEPDVPDDDLEPPTLFLNNPNGNGGPTVALGESFQVPGAFSIRYNASSLQFTWTDRTRPRAPRVSAPRRAAVGKAVRIAWTSADAGSGIASCTLSIDRRTVTRGEATGTFSIATLKRGEHTVSVICVDRAANRSRPAVKRIRVGRSR